MTHKYYQYLETVRTPAKGHTNIISHQETVRTVNTVTHQYYQYLETVRTPVK